MLLPTKALPGAKSRLLAGFDAAESTNEAHAALVLAIRSDTLAAAHRAPGVGRILVIKDRDDDQPDTGVHVLVQSEPGLNNALREGAALAAARWPDDGVAALVGDLPALRPEDLDEALAAAAHHARAYVADAAGTGTTLLTAGPGTELLPEFGAGSAARHARTAAVLPAGRGLRQDVDTTEDLAAAAAIGLGPATRATVAAVLGPV